MILEAIEDKPILVEKYKKACSCLVEVDAKLKIENDNMTDREVEEITQICERWGHIWPI